MTADTGPAMHQRHLLAAASAVALLLAACSGGGGPIDGPEAALDAVEAMAGQSMRWSVGVDVLLDEDEIGRVSEELGLGDPGDPEDLAAINDVGEVLADLRLEGAVAEDQSSRFDVVYDGSSLLSMVRSGGPDPEAVQDPDRMLEPFDMTVFLRFDDEAIESLFDAVPGPTPDVSSALDGARSMAGAVLGESSEMLAVTDALFDGGWAGMTGTYDPAGMAEEMGVGEDLLREAIGADTVPPADAEALAADLADTLEVTDVEGRDGTTTASVSIALRKLVRVFVEFAEQFGPTMGQPFPEDDVDLAAFPETVDDLATLTFEGDGVLTAVTVDLVRAFAANPEVLEAMDLGDDVDPQDAAAAYEALERSRVRLTVTFSDHGEVDTVVDVDATTATWDQFFEVMGAAAADIGPSGGPLDLPSDGTQPFTYGDDAYLDGLWDACEDGDGQACDDLYFESPYDSEYETFGDTCGGRSQGGEFCADLAA